MKDNLFRGLGAILFKEFIVVWRDPMTLFFMFFPPLIEMVAFGYALDTDVKHMAMVVYNEDRTVESRQLIDRFVNTETFRVVREVPGVIGVVLQIGTTVATAMALVRERERGTLEQLLVSPLSRAGLMLGKIIPYLCIGMAMAIVLFIIMRFVFSVPIAGNLVAMLFSTLVYVFALLSLGLLVGTKAENQMQALQMSMVFLLPSVFFSGFIFPLQTMPWIFYALGALFPTTYFILLIRAILLRVAHFFEYWPIPAL